jgi:hypothetical protein
MPTIMSPITATPGGIRETLVCRLGVILLRLEELVVEVNVKLPARFQLPWPANNSEVMFERVCRLEVITLPVSEDTDVIPSVPLCL